VGVGRLKKGRETGERGRKGDKKLSQTHDIVGQGEDWDRLKLERMVPGLSEYLKRTATETGNRCCQD